MGIKFKDNSLTTLSGSISNVAATLTVAAGKGDNFPAVVGAGAPGAAPDYFVITMENAAGVRELIRVENRTAGSDVLGSGGYPLVRGYLGTAAVAWTAGDSVDLRLPAAVLTALLTAGGIANVPAGNIAATDVQTALNELDTEKMALAGGTITGALTVNGTVTAAAALTVGGTLTSNGTGGNVWSTGDAKITLKTVPDTGWVMANDGTLGDAASGGTCRANADTAALFTLLWTNFVDADCPVSAGRGASAAADFAAHKNIRLPLLLGRAIALAGTGATLTARTLGHAVGEETHAQSVAELPVHTPTFNDPGHIHSIAASSTAVTGGTTVTTNSNNNSAAATTSSNTSNITMNPIGSGTPFNVMQPTNFLNAMVKL